MSSAEFQTISEQLNRIERLTALSAKTVLTIEECHLLTGLSVKYLYALTSQGRIPHSRRGKYLYFHKSEIEDWLMANKRLTEEEREERAATYLTMKGNGGSRKNPHK